MQRLLGCSPLQSWLVASVPPSDQPSVWVAVNNLKQVFTLHEGQMCRWGPQVTEPVGFMKIT